MIDTRDKIWVNDTTGCPKIKGTLEISKSRSGIFIGGDPEALYSLANLLIWLANIDQESLLTQPDGMRFHIHLHAKDIKGFNSLTCFSEETEIYRLDAKGTGDFPKKYCRQKMNKRQKGIKIKKVKKERKEGQRKHK